MGILNYIEFLIETYDIDHSSKSKEVFLLACAQKAGASVEESASLSFFINEGYEKELFEIASEINEESFAEKFKNLAVIAKEKIKEDEE